MDETLGLEGMWPELFDGLDEGERGAITEAFAANWHEGWQPNYEDVRDLVELRRGLIDETEYRARTFAKVDRLYPAKVAA